MTLHRLFATSFIPAAIATIALTVAGCGSEDPGPPSQPVSADASAQANPPIAADPAPTPAPTEVAAAPARDVADAAAADDAPAASSVELLPAGVHPDESAAECVRRVLNQTRAAYARLGVADVIVHEQTVLGELELPPIRHLARFASRESAYVEDQYARLTIVDGTMFYQHVNRPEDFARVRYSGDLSDALGAFRSVSILPVALYAGRDVDYLLPILRLGGVVDLRPHSCRTVTDDDGRTLTRLHLVGSEADTYVDIDPESGHIVSMNATFQLPNEIVMLYERRFDVEIVEYDTLPSPIVFDSTGLQEWPSIQMVIQLNQRPAAPITQPMVPMEPGESAPPFELRTLYGQRYPFKPDGGKYTILAFWSAPHSETPRFLAEMEALQRWFNEMTFDGQVIAVNSLDGRAVLDRFDATFDFWERREWGMPALFDENDDVAKLYRISPVPAAVLIAPDGEVLGVWNGQGRGYQMVVRELVTGHAEGTGDEAQP